MYTVLDDLIGNTIYNLSRNGVITPSNISSYDLYDIYSKYIDINSEKLEIVDYNSCNLNKGDILTIFSNLFSIFLIRKSIIKSIILINTDLASNISGKYKGYTYTIGKTSYNTLEEFIENLDDSGSIDEKYVNADGDVITDSIIYLTKGFLSGYYNVTFGGVSLGKGVNTLNIITCDNTINVNIDVSNVSKKPDLILESNLLTEDSLLKIPNNQIWYTTTNNKIYDMQKNIDYLMNNTTTFVLKYKILSNLYFSNGIGVITFDLDIINIGGILNRDVYYSDIDDYETDLYITFYDILNDPEEGSNNTITSITLPNSVININNGAFDVCKVLCKINFGTNVKNIYSSAFYNCESLNSINLTNLDYLDIESFSDCTNLIDVVIPYSKTYYLSRSVGIFSNCNKIKKVTYESGCTKTFELGCKNVSEVYLPDTITTITSGSFANCSKLIKVTIPDSITNIEGAAFQSCTSLATIHIPNNLTNIPYSCFLNCSSLNNLTIPVSVTEFTTNCFSGCSSMYTINYEGTKEQWEAITKYSEWSSSFPKTFTINCSNGTI